MNQKTKEWARQQNFQSSPKIVANQLDLIPDVFRNEDDTIPSGKSSVAAGMNGIMLLDYENAALWVAETNIISSDECALLVLGHCCPSPDPKRCCKTNIPVKTANGQTAIVAACMHNVGQKKIKIHYDEAKESVAVKEGSIIAIAIFREQVQNADRSVVAAQPCQICLANTRF